MRHSNPLVQTQTLEKPRGTNLTVGSIYTVWWARKSLKKKKNLVSLILAPTKARFPSYFHLVEKQQATTKTTREREKREEERKKKKKQSLLISNENSSCARTKGKWVDERGRLERTRLHAAGRDKFCERTAWKVERAHRALCYRT